MAAVACEAHVAETEETAVRSVVRKGKFLSDILQEKKAGLQHSSSMMSRHLRPFAFGRAARAITRIVHLQENHENLMQNPPSPLSYFLKEFKVDLA